MTAKGRLSEAIATTQGRLARTLQHVLRRWIPVNTKTLDHIKEGIDNGRYEKDREQLNQDLKTDISLYTWCLRRLCEISELDPQKDEEFDPIKSLEELDLGNLRFILETSPNDISQHSLSTSNEEQKQLLKEAVLGAAAVEVISEEKHGDSRVYGSMLLRKLGITLIAWNYPTLYTEVMEEVKNGKDLDTEMAKKIGFSPGLLASEMVESWGVSKKKRFSLGLENKDDDLSNEKNYLHKICEFGEKLVRANNPENYPKAKNDWTEIEKQIKGVIGEDGVNKIVERFNLYSTQYKESIPQFIQGQGPLYKTILPHEKNTYVEACEKPLKETLIKLYASLAEGAQSQQELLGLLIRNIIPATGFTGGCVYTVDPTLGKLIPQLHFGSLKLHEVKTLDYTSALSEKNMVVDALEKSKVQSMEEEVPGEGKFLGIAHGIGGKRRLGVLYLERPYGDNPYAVEQHMTHFRAFEKTLTDCLS